LASKICQANCPGWKEDHAAVLRVGVIAEIGAFVDEALALGVDVDAPGIRMLLNWSPTARSPNSGAFLSQATAWQPDQLPTGAAPMASAMRDDVAGVEARAAHLGELPAGPQVARAHFGVRLEAAGGEHDRPGFDFGRLAGALHTTP